MDDKQIKKWLAEGKISEEQASMMITENSAAAKSKSSGRFLSVISVLGSIFLGIGVIWVVASNWDGIPDALKTILLIAFTGGLIYSGYVLGYSKKNYPKTGYALVLLGAILFGASIFLIAQTYNVEAHESYLLLFWLAGVLPLVYIFQSPLIAFLSCVVFCMWFNSMVIHDLESTDVSFIWFFYQTFGLLLFAIGSLHYFVEKYTKVARAYRLIGIFLVLCVLMVLTFKFYYKGFGFIDMEYVSNPLILSVIYFFIIALLGINVRFNPSKSNTNVLENAIAFVILTVIYFLNLSVVGMGNFLIFWILFNALFVGLITVLFRIGYNRQDMVLVNIASISIFVFLIFKFFDIFSDLLHNGLTWMIFGIVLLTSSILFEKRRRKIRDSFDADDKITPNNG